MGETGLGTDIAQSERRISGPATLKPVGEAPRASTNSTAQRGPATIDNLASIREASPAQVPSAR